MSWLSETQQPSIHFSAPSLALQDLTRLSTETKPIQQNNKHFGHKQHECWEKLKAQASDSHLKKKDYWKFKMNWTLKTSIEIKILEIALVSRDSSSPPKCCVFFCGRRKKSSWFVSSNLKKIQIWNKVG